MPEIRIKIDSYEPGLNKNENKRNRVLYGLPPGVKKFKDDCIMIIRGNLNAKGIRFTDPKSISVRLILYRANPLIDAQNFGDAFWDIVEDALNDGNPGTPKFNDRDFKTSAEPVDIEGKHSYFEIILKGD